MIFFAAYYVTAFCGSLYLLRALPSRDRSLFGLLVGATFGFLVWPAYLYPIISGKRDALLHGAASHG